MKKLVVIVIIMAIPLLASAGGKYKEGFQTLKWGDSFQNVKAKFPDGRSVEGGWAVETAIEGEPVLISFDFYKTQLFSVGVSYCQQVGNDLCLAKFEKLKILLMTKYGEPSENVEKNEQYYFIQWITEESSIFLLLYPLTGKFNLTVGYSCKDLSTEKIKQNIKEGKYK